MANILVQTAPLASKRQPVLFAHFAREVLKGIVLLNRGAIRAGIVPPLYRSGVTYREEPPGVETFRDAETVLELGHGDCAHLAAWRVAELRERGEPASLRITSKLSVLRPGTRLYHIVVRRGDGSVEDPSRKLGMGKEAVL